LTCARSSAPLGPSASFHAGPVTSILERTLAASSHLSLPAGNISEKIARAISHN